MSVARNSGMETAKGKYIMFIDPDDYVDLNTLNSVLDDAESRKAEISFLGFTYLDINGHVKKSIFNNSLKSCIYSGADSYFLSRVDGQTDPDRIWAVLMQGIFLIEIIYGFYKTFLI